MPDILYLQLHLLLIMTGDQIDQKCFRLAVFPS